MRNAISSTFLIVLIIAGLVLLIVLWRLLKPYMIKHDTTILFSGGLGSGKTLESVKQSIVLIRKQRFLKYKVYNFWNVKIHNYFVSLHNWRVKRHNKKVEQYASKKYIPIWYRKKKALWQERVKRKKPMLYSNIPVYYKTHIFGKEREWAIQLEECHLVLTKEITEYSVVFIDEMPQFVNQFSWNEKIVQENLNEFITFFRHYIGGYLIVNAQSEDDIVVQFRRKMNQGVWCFDFKKHFFGLFYTNRMCDYIISDSIQTMSNTYIEENTKLHFGLFPSKRTYDTRCYSVRYLNVLDPAKPRLKWSNLKTTKVIRMKEYVSPLDTETTTYEKDQMKQKALKLARKADYVKEVSTSSNSK